MIHVISQIEECLWSYKCGRNQSMCASIRDRFQFLMTLSGCLRSESMMKADLSDLCDLVYQQKSERSPYQILIMRIGEGKTVHDKNIFGRLLRHVDVRRCAFGALGLWLLSRFKETNEVNEYNFNDNSTWFNSKLMISSQYRKNKLNINSLCTKMSTRAFFNKVTEVCKMLGVKTPKFAHFGRNMAPKICELEDCSKDSIDMIGYWNVDVRKSCYSTNLPLEAMRVMAGSDKYKGRYVNKRSEFFGDREHFLLTKLIFPWIEMAETTLLEKNITAKEFFTLLKNLRWVILQDAAVLIGVHNRKHSLYESMPEIFQSKEFKSFTSKMMSYINHSTCDEKNEILIERVLPGINSKISNQTTAINSLEKVTNSLEKVIMNSDNDSNNNFNNIEHSLRAFCEHIGKFPDFNNNEKKKLILQNKGNDMITQQTKVNDVIETPHMKIHDKPNKPYLSIPKKFSNVAQILLFWNENNFEMENKKYRKQFTQNEKQRIYRISQVIKHFHQQSRLTNVVDTTEQFEIYFKETNQSMYSLSRNSWSGII